MVLWTLNMFPYTSGVESFWFWIEFRSSFHNILLHLPFPLTFPWHLWMGNSQVRIKSSDNTFLLSWRNRTLLLKNLPRMNYLLTRERKIERRGGKVSSNALQSNFIENYAIDINVSPFQPFILYVQTMRFNFCVILIYNLSFNCQYFINKFCINIL